jgi:hypothetical protein
MELVKLTETEKKLLRALAESEYTENILPEIPRDLLGVAAQYLKNHGFIDAMINYGEILDAGIEPKGKYYLNENPNLDDPISVDIERLTFDNLKYQKRTRIFAAISAISVIINLLLLIFNYLK